MCQKCTAPGPATGSLYLTISQTVLSAEREKEKGRNRGRVCAALCTHKCSSYSEGQRPHTLCTHTTHHTQQHTQGALWSVGSFALCFYLFQWFGNKRSHGSSAKRCHLGAILYRTPAATPPSAWAISGFVDCLTNCQQQRRQRRRQTVCPADKCSHSCSFSTACHCCFCTPPPPLSLVLLLLLCCQALTSDARFPRHRWPVSKRHCQ